MEFVCYRVEYRVYDDNIIFVSSAIPTEYRQTGATKLLLFVL